MTTERELPRYKCHKVVRALKIAAVTEQYDAHTHELQGIIRPADAGYTPFNVGREYMAKHQPRPGGYYVVYDGGYESYSPADAFEAGYARLSP